MLKQRKGVWLVDTYVNGSRLRRSTGQADRAAALAAASTIIGEYTGHGQAHPNGQGPTIEQAYDDAMRTRRQWRDAKDPSSIAGLYAGIARSFGDNRALASITRQELVERMALWQRGGLSASTINHRLSLLSVLFKTAGVVMPKVDRMTVRPGRVRIITDAELRSVNDWCLHAGERDARNLFTFLSHTAMRLSEALRLRWADLNLVDHTARIHETKADLPRTIPLSKTAVSMLLSYSQNRSAGPWCHLTVDRCDHLWAKARKAIGLAHDPEFVIHALRHTSLTRLAAAGVDALRIKAFAGHKQIATTQRYVHLAAHDLRDLARVQDGLPAEGHWGTSSPSGQCPGVAGDPPKPRSSQSPPFTIPSR